MSTIEETEEIEQARQQIQGLFDQITKAAQGDAAEAEFFALTLERVMEAMEAVAGLVWLRTAGGGVEPIAHRGVERTGIAAAGDIQSAHTTLVQTLFGNPMPAGLLVPPAASLSGPDGKRIAGNPTDLLVVAAPIDRSGTRQGLIEILLPPTTDDVQRGYLKFVEQIAAIASTYLERRQVSVLDSQQTALAQVDRFSRAVHETLDPVAAAFVLANEARRIVDCDRVSVLVKHRGRLRLEAVSGQESIERRATAVQSLEALARVVARAGDPLWHPDPSQELPPQIEDELDAYIDESHATALAIIPLHKPRPTPVVKSGGVDAVAVAKAEAAPKQNPEPIGALVAEWFSARTIAPRQRACVEIVADHGKIALANALDHTTLPFYGLISLLGKSRVLTTARNLPRTVLAAAGLAAALAALVLVRAELRLEARGTIEPVHRRDVFARIDGVVERIEPGIEHGAEVKTGQLLATLRNTDLEVAITDVLGRKASAEEQLVATQRSLLADTKLSTDERTRLNGRAAQLRREIDSFDEQLGLYETKKKDLLVTSPLDGVVTTWHVRDRLMFRPVQTGQSLVSVADKTGPWELEVHLPDDRLGHVNRALAAAEASGRPLQVDYIVATNPGVRHRGSVREIHEQAEVRGEAGNTVLVRIEIETDRHEREELGAGASVTARIACGRKPLGYVWFHDVLGFIQKNVFFRLW